MITAGLFTKLSCAAALALCTGHVKHFAILHIEPSSPDLCLDIARCVQHAARGRLSNICHA